MAIVKMKHLRLAALQSDREALLQLLQRMGCVEISEPAAVPDDPIWASLSRVDNSGLSAAREEQGEAERALAVLKQYAPEKSGLLQPRPGLCEAEFMDEAAAQRARQAAAEINRADRRIHAIRSEQSKLDAQKAALAPWLELDLPLETQSTQQVTIQLGILPSNVIFEEVEGAIQAESELTRLTRISTDREQHYALLICHKSSEEAVLSELKAQGWSRANLREWTGTAAENTARLEQEKAELEAELERLKADLAGWGEMRLPLKQLADRTAVSAGLETAQGRLMGTEEVFFLEGWVPEEDWSRVEQGLKNILCAYEIRDPVPEEYPNVPVKLKNNVFSRCMNVVTEMYSLPAYDGVDPNPLMAPFFILFFGMMMADMAYGLLMIAGALLVLKRTRPREGTRNFMEGVFWCGISTLIWCALTGGFFGDFIPQILKIIDPASNFVMPALFTPLDDTVAIMLGSVILGCIQIITGMTVSIVTKTRAGDFLDALFDEITWWIILSGVGLAIFGIGTVAGVPVVLVMGILMLVFGGTRQAKGFGKVTKLVGLVYNGVTGFFSDALSYVRLMALMLSGSVIASVFNTLAATFGNVILFVIISMIGNALNLALNLLGCYVHDLRLQCLEFFNRFYKEGGKPYRPLTFQTKYVDLIKEEQ